MMRRPAVSLIGVVLVSTVFAGVPATNVSAVSVLNVANVLPLTNPRTSEVIVMAGAVGDTLNLTATGITGSGTVTFTGTACSVPATSNPSGAFSVVIPACAVTGPITLTVGAASAVSTTFQVWVSRSEPYVMPTGHVNVTLEDLRFILDQIKIAEAHADRTRAATATLAPSPNAPSATIRFPYDITSAGRCMSAADLAAAGTAAYGPTLLSDVYTWTNLDPWGLRQVDGQCNNITDVRAATAPTSSYNQVLGPNDTAGWGASDQRFDLLTPTALSPSTTYTLSAVQDAYKDANSSVRDSSPRLISNLISDQSTANPAALAASTYSYSTLYGTSPVQTTSVNATTGEARTVYEIPNVTADYNVSAGFTSWFTLFGQFFDHGLDLIPKGGGSVLIPLQQDDPLYISNPSAPNFMVLTRGAAAGGAILNATSPYVDQSQAYGSHPSQNFFVREYTFAAGTGVPSSNGRLIESLDEAYTTLPSAWLSNLTRGGTLTHASGDIERSNGGIPTWRDIKAQARLLGFNLTDFDARSVPVIATDQYGRFTPSPTGMPMMLFSNGTQYVWAWGSAAAPIGTGAKTNSNTAGGTSLPGQTGSSWVAVSSGHPFINDTMATAVPFGTNGQPLAPDADTVMNSSLATAAGYYDDEALAAHYVAGDGRINENIALVAVHHAFHTEHNTVLVDIKSLLQNHPLVDTDFRNEWNGERLYQAARFVNEMEYQHMAFDEFVRRIAPNLPVFLQYNATVNPAISQEFASAVYRLGHSMLNETLARSNPGKVYDPNDNQDVSLVEGFTNPAQVRLRRPVVISNASRSGSTYSYTIASGETAPPVGAVVTISGMDDGAYNISSAVVATSNSTSFSVSTRFPGGATSSAQALTGSGGATSSSRTAPADGSLLAHAQINDLRGSFDMSPGTAAASVAQGMSSQRGNEIDEFVTDSVRNNLLGLPLDLASLNITRGRDVGLPTLNQFRSQNAATLAPYTSWADFIAALRYPESGPNFVAAYGKHPSITAPVAVANVSGATASTVTSGIEIVYTVDGVTNLKVGDVVSISGLTQYNVANAVIAAVDAGAKTFTVNKAWSQSPTAAAAFPSRSALAADGPVGVAGSAGSATPSSGSGSVTREPSVAERRTRAETIVAATSGDMFEFINSTGAWASQPTGFDDIDLWIGGLAENPAKQPLTPPMLGPTFQFVFQEQMLRLQDSDRFYYLLRLAGRNLGEEIAAQKFTDIVRRNTPSAGPERTVAGGTGILGMTSPGFGVADCVFSTLAVPGSVACDPTTMSTMTNMLTHKGLDNVTGFLDPQATTGVGLAGGAGDDSILGSMGNNRLSGGLSGGDLIDGFGGDDILIGGPGEDLLKGGAGSDVIDAGESQAGDTTDGGSGPDYLHCGRCQGALASSIGEAGNDLVKGGLGGDLVLEGGEGDDWIEGLANGDFLFGDSGLAGAGAILGGGNDVVWGGEGIDAVFADSGEDILLAGDSGLDALDGGRGFDWLSYEYASRFDNGPATKPSVWLDLSGVNPNPLNNQGDAVLGVEGVSGGPGNDTLIGSLMTDVTVPYVIGTAGSTTLKMQGAWTQIADGMIASGAGISPYAIVVGPAAVATINGVTTTTVDLNVPLLRNLAGPVNFLSWQVRNPQLIAGLEPLLTGTPGWTKYTVVNPTARKWSGGNILLGGPGNDRFRIVGGGGIIHGGAMLHACLVVTVNGTRFSTGSDTQCDGGPGYSGMTPLDALMNNGTLRPSNVRIVRELKFLNATDAAAAQDVLELPGPASDYVFIPVSPLPANTISGYQVTGPDGIITTVYDVALVKFGTAAPVAMTTTRSTLSGLVLNPGTLSPKFAPGMRLYTATVPAFTASVQVVPTVTYGGATVKVNGLTVNSGVASSSISLQANAVTRINVVVTAPTGGQQTTYTIDISRASVVPTFDTPLGTKDGFTVNITNYSSSYLYNYAVTLGTVTVGAALGSTMPITVTGLNPGQSATLQATVSRVGYTDATGSTTGTAAANAALTPLFDTPVATANGFTVNMTNYDPTFTFAPSVTAPAWVAMGTAAGSTMPITVLGLSTGQSATVTVATSRVGNTNGSATVTGSSLPAPAWEPTFSIPVSSAKGFSVNVTNYDPAFTWTATTSAGTVTKGTASGSTLPLVVGGLLAGQSATVTVTTTRTTYSAGTATITAAASMGAALTPTFSTPVATGTGFTVNVTNYNGSWTFGATSTAGVVTIGTPGLSTLPITVTGLAAGQSATVTVTTTRTGYTVGSGSVTGTAPLAGLTPVFGIPVRTATSYTVTITNYNSLYKWTYKASAGFVTVGKASGSTITITVSGLTAGQLSTLTATTTRNGFMTSSASVTG